MKIEMKERPIAIFETKDEIWYMTRPLWNKSHKQAIRVLFTRATNETMDWIDEKNLLSPDKCANMLWDILNKNPFTSYMN